MKNATTIQKSVPSSHIAQLIIADGLRNIEANLQQGLGVGHSLTAVVYIQP